MLFICHIVEERVVFRELNALVPVYCREPSPCIIGLLTQKSCFEIFIVMKLLGIFYSI